MRSRKLVGILSVLLIIVLTITGCGARKEADNSQSIENSIAPQEAGSYSDAYDMDTTTSYTSNGDAKETEKPTAGTSDDMLTSTSAITSQENGPSALDKIIRRFYMDVETQEFDSLITKLNSEINRLQGYVETSKISGKSFYRDDLRVGSIVARIPKGQVDEFVSTVDENANVVNKEESSDNITLQYADIESRKKSLEIEQDRLFALLEKTDTLESIVTLESRLSDVRYQLQNYGTQLRTYDNQVEYSTVTLNIQEVNRMTPKVEVKENTWSRIRSGFGNSMYRLGQGFTNLFVWFVVNLPYLILWALFITIIVFIIVRIDKKKRSKEINPPTQGPKQN
jgi:hypothetical protein